MTKPSASTPRTRPYRGAIALVISLFFLWGIANSLNGILIKHFQLALDLNRGQAGLVDSAFYLGYFAFALPAGMLLQRWGYKRVIVAGLLLYATGALLFYPAAEWLRYGFFLFALFTIASGLAFLETAANPYMAQLGDPAHSARNLNLAQSFNGLSLIFGPLIGGLFILPTQELSVAELAALPAEAVAGLRATAARAVQGPYVAIALVVAAVAGLFVITPMPEPLPTAQRAPAAGLRGVRQHRHLLLGILALFCYMGAQASLWGFFIDYKLALSPDLHLGLVRWLYVAEGASATQMASFHLSLCLALFMVGRFAGTYLMNFVSPPRLLAFFVGATLVLLVLSVHTTGLLAVGSFMLTNLFTSVMFPTIFALSIKATGTDARLGSSLLIMAIVGGGVFPPLVGLLSERVGLQGAFWLPILCLSYVGFFALSGYRPRSAGRGRVLG